MKFNRTVKRHVTFTTVMLGIIFLVIGYYLVQVIRNIGDDFLITVLEKKTSLPNETSIAYQITDRKVYSVLHYTSTSSLDFVLLDKVLGCNLFQLLLSLLAVFQLFKVNTYWYNKKFSQRLYNQINALSITAAVMWLLAKIQGRYQDKLVDKISSQALSLADDQIFLYISLILLLLSLTLKSFAKQGNRLQQEQDLTI